MTIKRVINGEEIEIELSDFELRNAYTEVEHKGHIEDIKEKYYDWKGEEFPFDDKTADELATQAENILSKSDNYWESYWIAFEMALSDWMHSDNRF